MKKAILVPSDFGQSLKPVDNTLGKLDSEMINILQDMSMSSDVKLAKYNQVLQRYRSLQFQRNKPYELEIRTPNSSFNTESILKSMPKTKVPLAELLIDFIRKQSAIQIEENGELTVDKNRIRNSNIIDIVHDLVRDRKSKILPVGLEPLVRVLKRENVPLEYIGNKSRLTMFDIQQRHRWIE